MKRLIQLFKLIFTKEFNNSIEHYAQPEILKCYSNMIYLGLFPDENEVLDIIKLSNIKSIALIGAGTGREAKVFAENGYVVYAVEPVKAMRDIAYTNQNIIYYSSLDEIVENVDSIFITRNLPSLLKSKERNELLKKCFRSLKKSGVIFIQPDIMKLTWRNSFKLRLVSLVSDKFKIINDFEEGDTLRFNIDYNAINDCWCYYHYFVDSHDFITSIKRINVDAKVKTLSLGYFQINLL